METRISVVKRVQSGHARPPASRGRKMVDTAKPQMMELATLLDQIRSHVQNDGAIWTQVAEPHVIVSLRDKSGREIQRLTITCHPNDLYKINAQIERAAG